MTKRKAVYYWLAGLILCILAWPPSPFNFLIFLSYAPIYYAFLKTEKTKRAFFLLYTFFFVFLLIKSIGLFAEGENSYTMLIGLFLAPMFWCIPFIPVSFIKRKIGLVPSLITLIITVSLHEYWQYFWELSFNWYHLGLSLGSRDIATPLYQVFGISGVSILILTSNSILVYVWEKFIISRRPRIILSVSLIVSFLAISLINLADKSSTNKESIDMVVFSPTTESYTPLENNMPAQIDYLIGSIEEKDVSGSKLLVGPESYLQDLKDHPIFVNRLDDNVMIKRLQEVCDQRGISMVLGAILVELIPSSEYPSSTAKKKEDGLYFEVYNGSVYLQPNKKGEWRSKQVLLPFMESVPFHGIINPIARNVSWLPRYDNTFGIKRNDRPYRFKNHDFITSICYESLYPHLVNRKNHTKNIDFHLILTNDWTRDPITVSQYQDYCHAIVKSSEITAIMCSMNQWSLSLDFPFEKILINESELKSVKVNLTK